MYMEKCIIFLHFIHIFAFTNCPVVCENYLAQIFHVDSHLLRVHITLCKIYILQLYELLLLQYSHTLEH